MNICLWSVVLTSPVGTSGHNRQYGDDDNDDNDDDDDDDNGIGNIKSIARSSQRVVALSVLVLSALWPLTYEYPMGAVCH